MVENKSTPTPAAKELATLTPAFQKLVTPTPTSTPDPQIRPDTTVSGSDSSSDSEALLVL